MNKNIDYTALGKRIKNKRIEKGFTQEQLGELCELSAAHIGHIERGTRILSVDVLFRISQALDTSIDWLVFDSDENKKKPWNCVFMKFHRENRYLLCWERSGTGYTDMTIFICISITLWRLEFAEKAKGSLL